MDNYKIPVEIEIAIDFTETYKRYENEHIAIREAMCLKALYPAILTDIEEGGLFAGRVSHMPLGFRCTMKGPEVGYYCYEKEIRSILDETGLPQNYRKQLEQVVDFWKDKTTVYHARSRDTEFLPVESSNALYYCNIVDDPLERPAIMFYGGNGLAGTHLNFEKLLKVGISGMIEEIEQGRERAVLENGDVKLFEAMKMCDVYLGDFYACDIEFGRITGDKALYMLQSLWRLIEGTISNVASRIIIGGLGRPNEENADRFALLAMEATRTVKGLAPQLSLRLYRGINPEIFSKALDVIGEGNTFPILYNDDVNVPALMNAFGVSRREAEQYVVSDCGEYRLEHLAVGSPNGTFNLMKVLEITFYNGFDPVSGLPMGLKTGEFAGFKTFEELWEAYKKQIDHFIEVLAARLTPLYQTMAENAPYLFYSILHDDCIERGEGLISGARYLGVFIETYGNINAADSLTAIKQLVYEKRAISPERLLLALAANFEGYEKERRMMLNAPKYGNDDAEADSMALAVHNHVCSAVKAQGRKLGLDFCLADLVNANGHIVLGKHVGASPDGRLAGKPLTNANNPSSGSDRCGVTALLNSLVKLDPSNIGGQVQYMKFSRDMFTRQRDKLETLLNVYFSNGGSQAMITVVNRGDLENALKEPEKYANLMVRVGGFSARFVTLDKDLQEEILVRTLN